MAVVMLLARFAVALAAAALSASSARAASAGACSNDTFAMTGGPVTVEVCPPQNPAGSGKLTLEESFSVKGQAPLVREITVDLLPGSDSSRAIDDVGLQKLGIERSLHLTILYKAGSARLEHALLVPGAIVLK
jgi:hypothetical protein